MKNKFQVIDGVKCYAPAVAKDNQDYPSNFFEYLVQAEDNNFWFRSRNRIIQYLFGKYVGKNRANVLEIGCGTGFVLKGLKEKFPAYRLKGSEIHLEGIKYAKQRLPEVEFVQLDATQMPFEQEFDAIGAFDVLEHITEDVLVMQEIHRALKPDGFFLISVPQYRWMWSVTDDLAYHKRRYHRKELHDKLKKSGFKIEFTSSFVFTLFPLMWLSRILNQRKKSKVSHNSGLKNEALAELDLHPVMNTVFRFLMKFDEFLIATGVDLPFGGSLMVVAIKDKK